MRDPSKTERHPLPRHYTPGIRAILVAVIQAVRPATDGFERVSDDGVLRTVLSFVPYMPRAVRTAWPFGLWLLDKLPICFGYFHRFRALDIDDRSEFLIRLHGSLAPLRLLVDAMRSLIMLSFYQQPEVLELLEIDWQARARELIERRAHLQDMADEVANPRNALKENA